MASQFWNVVSDISGISGTFQGLELVLSYFTRLVTSMQGLSPEERRFYNHRISLLRDQYKALGDELGGTSSRGGAWPDPKILENISLATNLIFRLEKDAGSHRLLQNDQLKANLEENLERAQSLYSSVRDTAQFREIYQKTSTLTTDSEDEGAGKDIASITELLFDRKGEKMMSPKEIKQSGIYKEDKTLDSSNVLERFETYELVRCIVEKLPLGGGDEYKRRKSRIVLIALVLNSINVSSIAKPIQVIEGSDAFYTFTEARGVETLDRKLSQPISSEAKYKIMISVCKAIDGLHRKSIVHKNIGSHNVLVDDSYDAWIIGFHSSRFDSQGSDEPEVVQREKVKLRTVYDPFDDRKSRYTWHFDIYSLGVVMLETHLGCSFLSSTSIVSRKEVVAKAHSISGVIGGIIQSCIKIPEDTPTAFEDTPTAFEIQDKLERAAGHGSSLSPSTLPCTS